MTSVAVQSPFVADFTKSAFQQLDEAAVVPPLVQHLPLSRYYSSANELRAQAQIYLSEQDDERAFVFLKRFSTLVLRVIINHKEFMLKKYSKERKLYIDYADASLSECATIKERLRAKYEQAARQQEEEQADQLSHGLEQQHQQQELEQTQLVTGQEVAADITKGFNEMRHSTIAPPVVVDRAPSWDNLKLGFNAAPVEVKAPLPPASAASSTPIASYPTIQKSPSKPTVAPAAPTASTSQPKPPAKSSSSRSRPNSQTLTQLRQVLLPASVMGEFLNIAKPNTRLDIETCGILTGKLKDNTFVITTIVIPKQEATANTCVTHSEEDLFELQDKNGLLTLGWIHTHPTQTCFLSSIDLHTHFSYQVMLPEAIAIVMAPTSMPDSGIFSLSKKGMEVLGSCDRRGFHKHFDDDGLYGQAPHVKLDTSGRNKCNIIDLRNKK